MSVAFAVLVTLVAPLLPTSRRWPQATSGETGQPCQKQPSTMAATLMRVKVTALEVRGRLPKSVLIGGVNGSTHSGSLSGASCTDLIAAYLTGGSLPARVAGDRSARALSRLRRPSFVNTHGRQKAT